MLLLWIFAFGLFCFVLPQWIAHSPGLRRVTGFLCAYYALVALLWGVARTRADLGKRVRYLLMGAVLLQGTTNLAALGPNLGVSQEFVRQWNIEWFRAHGSAKEALAHWERFTKNRGVLRCGSAESCRYAEIYGAIRAFRRYAGLPDSVILAWDFHAGAPIVLENSIWRKREGF
jgi:hypothetical protein